MNTKKELEKKLRNYLCVYWLRPETAIWRVCDWLAIKDFSFEEPMLELACGDGINSYILLGGNPPLELDNSLSVKRVGHEEYFSGVDIYDDSTFRGRVGGLEIAPPPKIFDVGLDKKENLIEKAKLIRVHKEFVIHDMEIGRAHV